MRVSASAISKSPRTVCWVRRVKGLAQAFSSLAKGRGGICVNSAAKTFRLLAQIILDPAKDSTSHKADGPGGWTSFRATFGKPIGHSPRIQPWVGQATCHALASRVLGDLCFRLGANGVRDETQGMIAKVYATKALCYKPQSTPTRSRVDARYTPTNGGQLCGADGSDGLRQTDDFIENYIGENMHEFTIATVYEGPNPVLADVGAPNAMTRGIRSTYLEPIGLAELNGKLGMGEKARFGWFVARSVLGSLNPWTGSLEGVPSLFPEKQRYIQKALCRNRALGRAILFIIARYQTTFMDQTFLLGDEGGIFDKLSCSVASLVYALSLDKPDREYLLVAEALDYEADLLMKDKTSSPTLKAKFAEVGRLMMDSKSTLFRDLIADIDISGIPLDPRFVEKFV